MSTLSYIQEDLIDIIQNDSYRPRLTTWVNNAILEIARDFELPPLKMIKPIYFWLYQDAWYYPMPSLQPAWASGASYVARVVFTEDNPIPGTTPVVPATPASFGSLVYDATSDKVYQCITSHTSSAGDLPLSTSSKWRPLYSTNVTYHKKVTGARSYNNNWEVIPVSYEMAIIENLDGQHHDTGDTVEQIGVEDKFLGSYPRVNDVVSMYFYRMPVPMSKPNDVPDGVDDEFICDVLIPRVVVRNFRIINQMAIRPLLQNLKYWEDVQKHGEETMKLKLVKSKAIEKRGGSDPLP
jgi:hypothetical protein